MPFSIVSSFFGKIEDVAENLACFCSIFSITSSIQRNIENMIENDGKNFLTNKPRKYIFIAIEKP